MAAAGMGGSIYDYRTQGWTTINVDTDRQTGPYTLTTADGVQYEVNPDNPTEYRNATTVTP